MMNGRDKQAHNRRSRVLPQIGINVGVLSMVVMVALLGLAAGIAAFGISTPDQQPAISWNASDGALPVQDVLYIDDDPRLAALVVTSTVTSTVTPTASTTATPSATSATPAATRSSKEPSASQGKAERGAMYFMQFGCQSCHGSNGINPTGRHRIVIVDPKYLATKTDAEIVEVIRKGSAPPFYMRSYGRTISNQKLSDLLAWLRSHEKKAKRS
ncbi:MAG: cytochrome c [Anaerolineae bacterium]|nr:cytochrome c [Anaerolineae bacterium]